MASSDERRREVLAPCAGSPRPNPSLWDFDGVTRSRRCRPRRPRRYRERVASAIAAVQRSAPAPPIRCPCRRAHRDLSLPVAAVRARWPRRCRSSVSAPAPPVAFSIVTPLAMVKPVQAPIAYDTQPPPPSSYFKRSGAQVDVGVARADVADLVRPRRVPDARIEFARAVLVVDACRRRCRSPIPR